MLTYETVSGNGKTVHRVRLDGKWIGDIKEARKGDDSAGWYYQPKNSSLEGDVMPNVRAVQQSLELPTS